MRNFLRIAQKATLIFIALSGSFTTSFAQNWDQIIKANAKDREALSTGSRSNQDLYGRAVAISAKYAIVGAEWEESDANGKNPVNHAGAAFILRYEGGKWRQIQKICATNRGSNYGFGRSVAINGDYVIVGSDAELGSGAAYIFKKDQGGDENWGLVKRITAAIPDQSDHFGGSVSISGNYAVVGASGESEDAFEASTKAGAGAAYIFKKDQGGTDNWGPLRKLTPSDRATGDSFGNSVAIDGNYVIAGAINANLPGKVDAGAAYIFRMDNGGADKWNQSDKITAPVPGTENYFGTSVAKSGDNVIIGAHGDSGTGAAYIFRRYFGSFEYWTFGSKLLPSNAGSLASFGYSVAITARYAMVGAPGDDLDVLGANSKFFAGSVHFYQIHFGSETKWDFLRKVIAPVRKNGDELGYSVALFENKDTYENIAIVGTPFEDEDENEINPIDAGGAAYIVSDKMSNGNVFKVEQKMVMEDRPGNDNFGYSVAVSGDFAVVGAPNDDQDRDGENALVDAGAAYIFYNNAGNWVQTKKLTPNVRHAGDNFGQSVAISGTTVIVGAPNDDYNNIEEGYFTDAGAAYIFSVNQNGRAQWGQVRKITASNRSYYFGFGKSVSISENAVVVGSPCINLGYSAANFGYAYVFTKDQGGVNNWGLVKMVNAPVPLKGSNYGFSVSNSGDYVIVGSIFDLTDGNPAVSSGAAFIFKRDQGGANNWGFVKKIVGSAPKITDLFGWAVSMSGDYVIVGAYAEDENALDTDTKSASGSAYIFKKDQGGAGNWGLVKKIVASDRSQDDDFGWSVSINGTYAIVGAYREDEDRLLINTLENAGSAYIFKKDEGGVDGWGQINKIVPTGRQAGDEFGFAVAMGDNYALVGTPFNDKDNAEQNLLKGAGSIYIFHPAVSPLPVTLATFTAEKSENQALLRWTTTSETNADYFEIERSADGRLWITVGKVLAASESTSLLKYDFTDSKPFDGNNLYRLKMVDRAADGRDGTFAFSKIRSLSFEGKGNIAVYPNPVVGKLYVAETELSNVTAIKIINTLGQVVIYNTKITTDGIVTDQLSPGMYIVQIKKTDGKVQTQKVVVLK